MQTSLPLLIVQPSILNPVINFSTRLWPVKWNALGYTFALRIPFHLLHCWCNTCTNQSPNEMIHFISSCEHIGSSILTLLALHCCPSPLAPSYLNLSFTLATGPSNQVLSWSSPPWSHDSMSCLICNKLLHHMCETCNKSKLFHLHGNGCTHMYLWTNHLCISLKHILVHLKLSLNYQNQTRTFHMCNIRLKHLKHLEQYTRNIHV